ncbi:Putative P-loop containing nucleoside triphosphate hydrolase protein [Rhizopus microsporus]|nr:Putative P-loop containing nucleoside triphosphate hydrolase protein [Rhizopus microsporus]
MGRFLSTRDLMKWCHRVDLLLGEKLNDSSEVGMDLTLRQDLFNEANDCFCGMIPDYNIWMTVLQTIGKPLQISQELVRNYVDQYKPVLDVNDTHVRIGRVNLSSIAASGKQKKKAGLIKREKQRPFATTGHALRLMEKIAVSIHLNEPVLLVGETGTGKTTVVQHLADMIHQNLIVVNLSQQSDSSDLLGEDNKLVWTKAMRRLFSLVARCLRYDEPVLLVGDTGCGKTTVCQMLAETYGRELHIVNCHQNTETSDLLGGQRPVRGQDEDEDMDKPKHLFEWHDGPLVQSMKDGHLFLLDEISLADDSVLERLNSVLEPSRLLVLAEKGGKQVEELYAAPGFKFLATMNPGGDYGKKELSPALRNRFTEIWVPSVTDREDLISIIDEQMKHATLKGYSERMLDFISWYSQALGQSRTIISLRDILSWVKFMNTAVDFGLNPELSFAHGACIVLLDGLGSHGSSSSFMTGSTLKEFRLKCLRHLSGKPNATEQEVLGESRDTIVISDNKLAIGPFEIPRGKLSKANVKFTLSAPTTSDNAMRVVRAMQLRKPILLEGSPGVGKTSLISALAAASGHNLVRINLSEQTDLMDLFGSDLPVEGGNSGEFAWRDAPFLQAMKAGDWVLLDELNLASQSVLEGLNSCLDHRGAVWWS